jgi:hypothetical protein
MASGDATRTKIGVFPGAAHRARRRLFTALERALPVRFEPRDGDGSRDLDGAIVFGVDSNAVESLPTLVFGGAVATGGSGSVRLRQAPLLDQRLRGVSLPEDGVVGVEALRALVGDEVLAASSAGPLWLARELTNRAVLTPPELADGEPLAARLRPGRFLALLPLVHFLRNVCGDRNWTVPPMRAAFVVDDPNLHWTSYGYLRYGELVAHADRHGYHVAFATVPIDGWFARSGAAKLASLRRDRLSLLVHGNDHIRRELDRERTAVEAVAMVAQALRRVAAFERRHAVHVDRIMVPPHSACSVETLRALLKTRFEALCTRLPQPGVEGPLAGWGPAEISVPGLPVLPRTRFDEGLTSLPLNAFLDRPLLLYGHHGDFAEGLDLLADAAAAVNRLGEVHWGSLGTLAEASFLSRRSGGILEIRPYSRRIRVEIPPGVDELRVELTTEHAEPDRELVLGGNAPARFTDRVAELSAPAPGVVELSLVRDDAVDVQRVPAPPRRPWPFVRRFLSEGRDRARPLVGRRPRARARS